MFIEQNFILVIFLFFLCKSYNTYYTDYLIKHNDDIDNNYLILVNSLFCFKVSYLLSPKLEKQSMIIPYDKYIIISGLTFMNSQLGLYCLNFISVSNKNIISKMAIADRAPVLPNSKVLNIAKGKLATIPANIIIEIPLPNPCSVICSPNHIKKIVPEVIVMMADS